MRLAKTKKINLAYSVEKCYLDSNGVSDEAISDLQLFYDHLDSLSKTASKQTHYDRLDEWSGNVYKFVEKMLKKYGFINGSQLQNINAKFWWNVYSIVSHCVYSPNLETKVSTNHSSAFERNESIKKDIKQLQELLIFKNV